MVGIDAISFYVPNLYLDIKDLAAERDIPFEKLNKGLGLKKMAVPDINEDAASFAANALLKLIEDNNIDPNSVGRVYLGTESALDASKPTATYAIEAVENQLAATYGVRSFKNCDVVDMTFACVGAVDALQNCLDWVRNDHNRKAIVIASDVSKYELNSTGEYTQGAGAVAVLVSSNPSIMVIDDVWGVATKSEGDFFKPRRHFQKSSLINDLIENLDIKYSKEQVEDLLKAANSEFWSDPNQHYEVFKEEPVFDGQFSNQCYSDRITEAFDHFKKQHQTDFLSDWNYFVFHLPYAFHGRRIVFNNWLNWLKESGESEALNQEIGTPEDVTPKDWKRNAVKSKMYQKFIQDKIAPTELASSEIGNMYTASIFMSLLSVLCASIKKNEDLANTTIGFIGYGSGSKSKVFQGTVQPLYSEKIKNIELFKTLEERQQISVATYEALHTNALNEKISNKDVITVSHVETGENIKGLRKYSLRNE